MSKSKDTRTKDQVIADVLRLVDGYLAKQPQHVLMTDGRGLMTYAELRQHVAGALALLDAQPSAGVDPAR